MKYLSKILLSSTLIIAGAVTVARTTAAPAADNSLMLWYQQAAQQWTEALPIGNGRIGAMVFGGVNRERIQLNEDTLWGGGPYDPVNPQGKDALPQVRQMIFDGQYRQAGNLINSRVISKPSSEMPYETGGRSDSHFSRFRLR